MSTNWADHLGGMVARGTATQSTIDGAMNTWHLITEGEHYDLTTALHQRLAEEVGAVGT